MTAIDFTSVLACLLRDGALRDRFANDPEATIAELPQIEDGDRKAILQLDPKDLEVQATILLRKRFEEVRQVLPQTCASLGDSAWIDFQKYARHYWPDGEADVWADARVFAEYIKGDGRGLVSPAESNRLAFASGAWRVGVSWAWGLFVASRLRPAIQIFWRTRSGGWRELVLYLES